MNINKKQEKKNDINKVSDHVEAYKILLGCGIIILKEVHDRVKRNSDLLYY